MYPQTWRTDITELLDEAGSGIVETVGEEWLNACAKDESIYGVPTMKPVALTPMVIYRQDIVDALGIDMSTVIFYGRYDRYPETGKRGLSGYDPGGSGADGRDRRIR